MSAQLRETVDAYLAADRNSAAAAREVGVSASTFKDRLRKAEAEGLVPDESEEDKAPDWRATRTDSTALLEYKEGRFNTPEEAMRFAQLDPDVWEIEKTVVNGWDVTAKTSGDRMTTVQNKQVKIWVRRKVAQAHENAFDGILARIEKHAPKYPKLPRFKPPADPHLLTLALFDHHFGKLAWAAETGQTYDLKTAETLYLAAVDDLMGKVAGYNIESILFPVGQDFYHIDNGNNTTTNGTPQDVDGRYGRIIETGEMACIHAIDRLRLIAPVKVVWVPGNHDRTTSYHLCRTLAAWYRNEKRVTVDTGPQVRKYHRYGVNLLGLTHGNEEKHADLPMLMANERKDDWADITHREFFTGHYHKAKQLRFLPLDTHGGVLVRTLPSLCAADAWHARRGYFGGERTAECYLHSKAKGFVGSFSTDAGVGG